MLRLVYFYILFVSVLSHAQNHWEIIEDKSYAIEGNKFIGVDDFEFLYYFKNRNLIKTNTEFSYNYANLQRGAIDQVQIFSPLKIAVLHKQFNTVVLLDNRLSEIDIINFNDFFPIRTIGHIACANDNNIWLFNTQTLELELFNYNTLKTTQKSLPLDGNVIALESDYNNVYALTSTSLYHYNYNGSLLSKTPLEGMEDFKLWGDVLILKKDKSLYTKSSEDSEIVKIENIKKTIQQFFVMNQTLYIYDGENLHHYQLINR